MASRAHVLGWVLVGALALSACAAPGTGSSPPATSSALSTPPQSSGPAPTPQSSGPAPTPQPSGPAPTPQPADPAPPTTLPGDGPSVLRAAGSVVLVSAEVDAVMEALMSGVIVRTDSGCLALDDPAGALPVLWPHGTTLDADGTGVQVPEYGRVAVGDHVWSSGGSTSGERIAPALPEECTIPAGSSIAALQWLMDEPPPIPEPSAQPR